MRWQGPATREAAPTRTVRRDIDTGGSRGGVAEGAEARADWCLRLGGERDESKILETTSAARVDLHVLSVK